jgi:perosamine synthetase
MTSINEIIIPVADVTIGEEEVAAVAEVLRSGRLSSGPKIREFEEAFKAYTGARHAIAINNGTSALHVSLAALGIGPGDEVILPSLTFISTANVVLYQGATPVLCECDPETYNLTADNIRSCVTSRTKAIIPVEMNGLPLDYDEILEVARELNVAVILDSAESLGASYKGLSVGNIAPIHCFSFFPNKIITTGEGGMITTDSDELAAQFRMILNQGQDYRYHHIMLGYNYRMTELQAAVGVEQLKRIEQRLEEKVKLADYYKEALSNIPGVKTPEVPEYATRHSWYMYSIQVPRERRDAIVNDLAQQGIETRLSFPPIHTQPFYMEQYGYSEESLPICFDAWSRKIDIPIWPGLTTDQQDYVVKALSKASR